MVGWGFPMFLGMFTHQYFTPIITLALTRITEQTGLGWIGFFVGVLTRVNVHLPEKRNAGILMHSRQALYIPNPNVSMYVIKYTVTYIPF